MSKVRIFVEGVADVIFVQQYIKHLYGIELEKDHDIIDCKGWNNLMQEHIVNEMQKNSDNAGINIVIFDADANPSQRRSEIKEMATKSQVSFELFLFPNNESSGALEELLMSITNPQNKPVIDCWDRYEKDLSSQIIPWKDSQTPTIPAMKTKVYAYLESLLGTSKSQKKLIKEAERDYTNLNHWILSSPNITPLKDFLDKYQSEIKS